MTSPQVSSTTPATGPITTVTNVGLSLIQLGATAVTVPLKTIGALGVSLIRLGTSVMTVPIAVVAPQSRDEVVKATNDVADAAGRLYLSIINAVIGGIDSATRTINTTVTEATQPTRK
ncbi:MAG: hypothetical protein HGA45_43760 [Chloroflexales bacterium]|nr:hypothetical protein [Chloroflexales bacterium]